MPLSLPSPPAASSSYCGISSPSSQPAAAAPPAPPLPPPVLLVLHPVQSNLYEITMPHQPKNSCNGKVAIIYRFGTPEMFEVCRVGHLP